MNAAALGPDPEDKRQTQQPMKWKLVLQHKDGISVYRYDPPKVGFDVVCLISTPCIC